MKKLTLFVAALCATTMAVNAATFVKTDLTSIKNTDVVLIVGTTSDGSYAMSNDKGTSAAPTAVSVTVSGTSIETEATNILWNISYDAKTSTFTANVAGENDTLYCNNSNNGVRVGTKNANVLFNITNNYIYNTTQERYLGVYNKADWRCYTGTTSNIKDQTFAFYVKEVGPAVALENVEALEVYAENGRIYAAEGARIFTVSGIDVTEMNGQLNGIYIVKVGNQATKIAVK